MDRNVVAATDQEPATNAARLERRATDEQIRHLVECFARDASLSPRQTELVRHAVIGQHRKESASQLACQLKTVEGYWKRIYVKTGCCSEAEVVAKFIANIVQRPPVELSVRSSI
jgi:DNA-binding CsgD family transcriptional regulator